MAADAQGDAREQAIRHLVRCLRDEKLVNPRFPTLSTGAMRALASEIVGRNGYTRYPVNEAEAIRTVLGDRNTWEYYGVAGKLRRIARKMFGPNP
jgi:hypothetical protein